MSIKQRTFHSHPETRLTSLHKVLTSSSTTLPLVPREGLPISVPSTLLRMFSSFLPNILSNFPSCLEIGISLPDHDILTVSHLVELLTKGYTQNCKDLRPVRDLAKVLGIKLDNLVGLNSVVQEKMDNFSKTIIGPKSRVNKIKSGIQNNSEFMVKIKTETQDNSSAFIYRNVRESEPKIIVEPVEDGPKVRNVRESEPQIIVEPFEDGPKVHSDKKCFICPHEAKSLGSLRAHMCAQHFRKELKSNFSSFMHGKTCGLCQETLGSKIGLVIHIGAKHGRLNELLVKKGLPKIVTKTGVDSSSGKRKEHTQFLSKDDNTSDENTKYQVRTYNSKKTTGKIADGITLLSKCEVCSRELESLSKFSQHMSMHFSKELKDRFSNLLNVDQRTCLLCKKAFPPKSTLTSLILHIGAVHLKVEEIMLEKGLKPLVNDFAMPIPSSQVKKENPDIDLNGEELLHEEALQKEKDNSLSAESTYTYNPLSKAIYYSK